MPQSEITCSTCTLYFHISFSTVVLSILAPCVPTALVTLSSHFAFPTQGSCWKVPYRGGKAQEKTPPFFLGSWLPKPWLLLLLSSAFKQLGFFLCILFGSYNSWQECKSDRKSVIGHQHTVLWLAYLRDLSLYVHKEPLLFFTYSLLWMGHQFN